MSWYPLGCNVLEGRWSSHDLPGSTPEIRLKSVCEIGHESSSFPNDFSRARARGDGPRAAGCFSLYYFGANSSADPNRNRASSVSISSEAWAVSGRLKGGESVRSLAKVSCLSWGPFQTS